MKISILKPLIVAVVATLTVSCGSNKTEQENTEAKKDSVLVNHTSCATFYAEAKAVDSVLMTANSLQKDVAERAINTFNQYASECGNDSLAPVYLLKAGQVAQSIGNYKQAEILLKKCSDLFPQFRNRGAVLFVLAQLYDDANMLNNEAEAKKIYEDIIKNYPNTAWERDAKASISNLGKSDEKLIQEFLKKNK